MPAIVDFDQILADVLKDKPLHRSLQRPAKGEEISDERYAEALRNWEEYWKIEYLTNEDHRRLLDLAGDSKEYYIAKHSVGNAKIFVGTLEVNGHSTVIGDSAFYRHSDIDW
jgi:hypothetical protein